MADKIKLNIVAPDRTLFKGTVEELYAPGILGEFGILEGHAPYFTEIEPGAVHWKADGVDKSAAVAEGFASVHSDTITLLVEAAEFPEEIDPVKAEAYRVRAEEKLSNMTLFDPDYRFWKLREMRALNRLLLAKGNTANQH